MELGGKTLGIIGYGPSGVEVGRWAAAFGMNVVAYDPFVQEQEIHSGGAETVSAAGPFCVVRLHIAAPAIRRAHPRSDRTAGVVADEGWCSPGLRSGGGMIDEEALLACAQLREGGGRGAGRLCGRAPRCNATGQHPHVIATPQIGAQTVEARARAAEDIAREVLAALRGEPLDGELA